MAATAAWTEKGQHDFATEVDRAAEGMITEILTRGAPDSVIVGPKTTCPTSMLTLGVRFTASAISGAAEENLRSPSVP